VTPQRLGIWVALAAVVADQVVKNLLLYHFGFAGFAPGQRIEVLPFFDLVMAWNRGISYGLFQARSLLGTLVITAFSLVAIGVLGWWLKTAERRLLAAGLGLIIGGALGNLIDRVLYRAVVDFVLLHAHGYSFYIFNIADAAITIGVITLLVDAFFRNDSGKPDVPAARE
jgi:signal peptidase II